MSSLVGNKPNQVPTNGDLGKMAFKDQVAVGDLATLLPLTTLDLGGGGLSFRNAIINGNCRVGQYGAKSLSNNAIVYGGVDRIIGYPNSFTTCTGTLQQTSGNGTTTGYAQQATLTTTGTGSMIFATRLEAKDIARFGGRTVTISAKVYQDTGSALGTAIQLYKANATDNFSGSTQINTTVNTGNVASSSWTTISASFTPSAADATTGMMVFWQFQSVGAVTSKNFAIGDMQMTEGTVVLPIEVPPIQYDDALCKRYYYKQQSAGASSYFGSGYVNSATIAVSYISFPVQMRTAPTALEQSGTAGDYRTMSGVGAVTCSSVPTLNSADLWGATTSFTVASGLTTGQAFLARSVNSTAYLAWSAEL